MDNLRITYTPHPDGTLEREAETLAAVYAFVLECHANRKAFEANNEDIDSASVNPAIDRPGNKQLAAKHSVENWENRK